MIPLKEDGSLDIECIDQLPVEEHMRVLGEFTSRQMDEYLSRSSIIEDKNCPRNIIVDYTMEDELKRGSGVDMDVFLKKMKAELEKKEMIGPKSGLNLLILGCAQIYCAT